MYNTKLFGLMEDLACLVFPILAEFSALKLVIDCVIWVVWPHNGFKKKKVVGYSTYVEAELLQPSPIAEISFLGLGCVL